MSALSEHDKAVLNCVFNPHLPLEEAILQPQEELNDEEENTPEIQCASSLEIEAIALAERGNLSEALNVINSAVEMAPKKPSLYNNRAYIFQYLRKFQDALEDVTAAINLASEKHRKTLCQAHCQRGVLRRKFNNLDLAREDFEIAAKMGNQFAKAQLVELNPYAALCNQMLRQVTDALK
ncbi:hypothetical protein NQ318_022293 [Aromia moschata]|uniref:Tetratricopeptide repeat protein 36 n=1 Tax=Aromia moschata TaxID=1265417 RepID=A0AAV8Z4V4_9CUCU|nr:hypothetical protein NQ318_022293 [Aromia moschata]